MRAETCRALQRRCRRLGDLNPIRMRPERDRGDPQAAADLTYRPVDSASHLQMFAHVQPSNDDPRPCAWDLRLPDGQQYCFAQDGYVSTIRHPNGNYISVIWEPSPGTDRKQVSTATRVVAGATAESLKFAYEPEDAPRLKSVTLSVNGHAISTTSYAYESGPLTTIHDGTRLRETYTYWSAPVDAAPRVALEGMREYCDALCAPTAPAGCGLSVCERAIVANAPKCPSQCAEGCASGCEGLYKETSQVSCGRAKTAQQHEHCEKVVSDEHFAFMQACVPACMSTCVPKCQHADPRATCEGPCHVACMAQAAEPGKYVYGQPSDLSNNLQSITDATGKRVVYNTYGTDASKPSFDAVIEQSAAEGIPSHQLHVRRPRSTASTARGPGDRTHDDAAFHRVQPGGGKFFGRGLPGALYAACCSRRHAARLRHPGQFDRLYLSLPLAMGTASTS